MITTKQRAQLRGIANTIDTIFQIGKGGITEVFTNEISTALKAREIVKIKVLENCEISAREAAQQIAEKTDADIVQVIGGKLVLYKKNKKNPTIILVK
ncbi:MAG: YhbY family RNA-binding protein [Oscillospiraceae bacterium]